MKVLHKKSGVSHTAVIELVQDEDWTIIKNANNFEFDWLRQKDYLVHKITLELEEEILGLISIEDVPREMRVFIRLIELNQQQQGKNKLYADVAGCLLAFTCNLAFQKGYNGFVSLISKTALIAHYKTKYGFQELGNHLYLELDRSEKLINQYLQHE